MPRKGENIYKRKDGRWEGRYIKSRSLEGKVRYGYVYAKTYREVKEKLLIQRTLKESSINPIEKKGVDTFQSVAEEWFKMIQPQVKQSTSNKYRNLLKSYLYPTFGNLTLNCITHDYIEEKCNRLLLNGGKQELGLSAKTISDMLSVMRSILKFAIRNGKIVSCDASSIRIKHTSRKMRVLSRMEQEALCGYLHSDLNGKNIGILVCLFTGLRVGEVCALRWEDISIREKTIHVHQTMQRIQDMSDSENKTKIVITAPKSDCSIRLIPISDELVKIITSYKDCEQGYFLTNSDTHFLEPKIMQNHFKKVLRECNVEDANYHALRHTFATRCVEVGFDVKSLSEILGHANVNITMNRYVHPSMELKRENIEKLSVLLTVKKNGQE